jgi:hypothetical protein
VAVIGLGVGTLAAAYYLVSTYALPAGEAGGQLQDDAARALDKEEALQRK